MASDLYTVARTLAVLTFDFQGYTNVYADSLPDPDNIEVFRQYESFYRLLVRATDPDPARRFASAQEMTEQLTGVLREVVSLQTGPRPARPVHPVRSRTAGHGHGVVPAAGRGGVPAGGAGGADTARCPDRCRAARRSPGRPPPRFPAAGFLAPGVPSAGLPRASSSPSTPPPPPSPCPSRGSTRPTPTPVSWRA